MRPHVVHQCQKSLEVPGQTRSFPLAPSVKSAAQRSPRRRPARWLHQRLFSTSSCGSPRVSPDGDAFAGATGLAIFMSGIGMAHLRASAGAQVADAEPGLRLASSEYNWGRSSARTSAGTCSAPHHPLPSTRPCWVFHFQWGQCCGKPCVESSESLPGVACNTVPAKAAGAEKYLKSSRIPFFAGHKESFATIAPRSDLR